MNDSIKLQKRKQYEKINGLITDQISLLKDSGYKCSNIIQDYIQKISEKQSKKGIKRDHQIAIKKLDQLRTESFFNELINAHYTKCWLVILLKFKVKINVF